MNSTDVEDLHDIVRTVSPNNSSFLSEADASEFEEDQNETFPWLLAPLSCTTIVLNITVLIFSSKKLSSSKSSKTIPVETIFSRFTKCYVVLQRCLCVSDVLMVFYGGLRTLLGSTQPSLVNLHIADSLMFTSLCATLLISLSFTVYCFFVLDATINSSRRFHFLCSMDKRSIVSLMIILWNSATIVGFLPQISWNRRVEDFFIFFDSPYLLSICIGAELSFFVILILHIRMQVMIKSRNIRMLMQTNSRHCQHRTLPRSSSTILSNQTIAQHSTRSTTTYCLCSLSCTSNGNMTDTTQREFTDRLRRFQCRRFCTMLTRTSTESKRFSLMIYILRLDIISQFLVYTPFFIYLALHCQVCVLSSPHIDTDHRYMTVFLSLFLVRSTICAVVRLSLYFKQLRTIFRKCTTCCYLDFIRTY